MSDLETAEELFKTLSFVRNKQVEAFDRIGVLEERLQDLLSRFRQIEDRIVRLEKVTELRKSAYGR